MNIRYWKTKAFQVKVGGSRKAVERVGQINTNIMKRISKLNLVNLYKDEMGKREMSSIEGACEDCCGCGCQNDNMVFNTSMNSFYKYSKGEPGPVCGCICWGGDSDAQNYYQQTGTWPW